MGVVPERGPLRQASVAACLCLAGLVPEALAAPSTWREHYAKGESALRRQEWREAIDQLSRAIEANPESALPSEGIGYFPYFKLGIAYFNDGQYDAAHQVFEFERTLGRIADSPTDASNLDSFDRLVQRALGSGTTEREREARIARALSDARELEEQVRPSDALLTLGRALAADPGESRLVAAAEALRVRVAEQEQRREDEQRADRLRNEGRQLAEAGDFEEASSRFRQALTIAESGETRLLLGETQRKLRERLGSGRPADQPPALAAEHLRQAESFAAEGRIAEALGVLETALAVDPQQSAARALQRRLLEEQESAERARARQAQVTSLLDEAARLLAQGEPGQAAARLSLVLALDPQAEGARADLDQALRALAPSGPGPRRSAIPPAIALLNAVPGPGAIPDAARAGESVAPLEAAVEETSSARWVLAGLVVDDQPHLELRYLRATGDEYADVERTELHGERAGENLYRFRFSRIFPLEPGLAAWKIVATDRDGLSAEAVHRVRYARPWTHSPWFYGSTTVVVAFLLAGGYLRQRQASRRLRRRRFNPYVAGAPILDQALFFGREQLMSRVLQSIHNNSLMLFGERRIGKTSFLHQLKRRLQELDDPAWVFFPVYVDLQGTPQERFFATIADEIFDELSGPLGGRSRRDQEPYDIRALVQDIRPALAALQRQQAKKVKLCLLIDEVDQLNTYDPRVNQRLRSLFMKSFADSLVAVVTGVGIHKHWDSEGSPWYNFFEEIEVPPLEAQETRELIERPLRGMFRIDRAAIDRLVERSGGRPYLAQRMCMELVQRLHEQGRRRLTRSDVDRLAGPAEG